MQRVLISTGIILGVLGQLPSAGWQEMSALGILGVVLIWIVTKTQPQMQRQVVDLTEMFAQTVKTIQAEHVVATNRFTEVTSQTLTKLDDWHERTIATEVELTKALTLLQKHCAEQLALRATVSA